MADAAHHDSVRTATAAKLNRRQLVKAGVWAAPAVAVTVAAPAFAASDPLAAFSSTTSFTTTSTGALEATLSLSGNATTTTTTLTYKVEYRRSGQSNDGNNWTQLTTGMVDVTGSNAATLGPYTLPGGTPKGTYQVRLTITLNGVSKVFIGEITV